MRSWRTCSPLPRRGAAQSIRTDRTRRAETRRPAAQIAARGERGLLERACRRRGPWLAYVPGLHGTHVLAPAGARARSAKAAREKSEPAPEGLRRRHGCGALVTWMGHGDVDLGLMGGGQAADEVELLRAGQVVPQARGVGHVAVHFDAVLCQWSTRRRAPVKRNQEV